MKFILKILILMFSLNLFSQLELKLEKNYADKVIKCEPIWVKLILENKSDKRIKIGVEGVVDLTKIDGFYFLINGREYRGPWRWPQVFVEYSVLSRDYLDKWEKKETYIDLRIMALEEGVYEMEGVLDLEGKIYKSNKIELEIEAPLGEDEEVYNYFYRKFAGESYKSKNERFMAMCHNLTEERQWINFILEKYPTSTYAGWALFSMPNGSWAIKNEETDKQRKRYRDMVEIFLQHHPEFIYSGTLALTAAYIALEFEDYKGACELFKKAKELPKKFPLTKEEEEIYKKLKDEGKCK